VFATGWWSAVVGAGKQVVKRLRSSANAIPQQSESPLRGSRKSRSEEIHQAQVGAQSLIADRPKTSGEEIPNSIFCAARPPTCEQPSAAVWFYISAREWRAMRGRRGPNGSGKRNRRSVESSAQLAYVKSRRPAARAFAVTGRSPTAQFGSTEPDCTAQACSCPAFLAVGNCTYPAYGGGGNCIAAGGNGNLCRANAWALGRQLRSQHTFPRKLPERFITLLRTMPPSPRAGA
jgi:hypothetical protein